MATILIVDDDSGVRNFLATVLGQRGHRLLQADNGADGFRYVMAEKPDLVISDILMPAMTGFELVRRIRSESRSALTPVIFLTGAFDGQDVGGQAALCQVRYVLSKPCKEEELIHIVEQALCEPPSPGMISSTEEFTLEQL